jgi:hypothetical protein
MDSTRLVIIATVAAGGLAAPPAVAQEMLRPGMVLVYQTPDGGGQEWKVDLAEADVSLGGWTGCHRVRFAAGGPGAAPDLRETCVADGVLHRWVAGDAAWRASRPILPGDTLDVATSRGVTRYLTGSATVDTISGRPVAVVETVVLTLDASGQVIRRLRERYATALGTATWGVFEVPDSSASEGWRAVQEFRLVAIRGDDP